MGDPNLNAYYYCAYFVASFLASTPYKCDILACVVDAYSYLTLSLKPLLAHCLSFFLSWIFFFFFFTLGLSLLLSPPCISSFLLPQGNCHHPSFMPILFYFMPILFYLLLFVGFHWSYLFGYAR